MLADCQQRADPTVAGTPLAKEEEEEEQQEPSGGGSEGLGGREA
jgi:hypothetical protein